MTLSVGNRVVKLDAEGKPMPQGGEMNVEFEVTEVTYGPDDTCYVVLKKVR